MSLLLKNGYVWQWGEVNRLDALSGKFLACDILLNPTGVISDVTPRHENEAIVFPQRDLTISPDRCSGSVVFSDANDPAAAPVTVVNLGGAYVLPGLMDAHLHVDFGELSKSFIDIRNMTVPNLIQRLKRVVEERTAQSGLLTEWVIGYGMTLSDARSTPFKPSDEYLSRYLLDAWFPETPVYLFSTCLHISLVNTAGLRKCGIKPVTVPFGFTGAALPTEATETKENINGNNLGTNVDDYHIGRMSDLLQAYAKKGLIELDITDCLTGVFYDTATAAFLLSSVLKHTGNVLDQFRQLTQLGLTSIQTCDRGDTVRETYRLLVQANLLPLRVFHTPWFEDVMDCYRKIADDKSDPLAGRENDRFTGWDANVRSLQKALDDEKGNGSSCRKAIRAELGTVLSPSPSSLLIVNRIKIFVDGSLGSRTAALHYPYKVKDDEPEVQTQQSGATLPAKVNRGSLCWSNEDLARRLLILKALSLRLEAHVIGDRAADQMLAALQEAEMYGKQWRPVLTHCSILSSDSMDTMRKMEVIANIQPHFVPMDAELIKEVLPPESLTNAFRWKRLLREKQVVCAGGSDAPICLPDPFIGMFDSMYRPTTDRFATLRSSKKPGIDAPVLEVDMDASFCPEERLTFSEALYLYTRGSALAAGLENTSDATQNGVVFENGNTNQSEDPEKLKTPLNMLRLGCIVPGYTADFTIIDRDISVDCATSLINARVLGTVVRGQTNMFDPRLEPKVLTHEK